jgi:hypothetical protein
VTKEGVCIPRCWAAVALLIATFIHALWLWKIHGSEVSDKEFWTRYRAEALPIIRGNDTLHDDEVPWRRTRGEKIVWLFLEVTVTVLLCGFLWEALPR